MKEKREFSPLHHHTSREELLCHTPYAVLSVSLSMIFLSLLGLGGFTPEGLRHLFHDFHYLHLVFSATGAVLIFRRYSPSVIGVLLVGIGVPAVFCTLSDSLLPFIGGWYLGLDMQFHWCFISGHLTSVLPFLFVGFFNGLVVGSHSVSKQIFYSAGSHFIHIFISSMASILYLVSFGFYHWHDNIAFVFLFLIGVVLIPCTLSDIVVPLFFARLNTAMIKKKRGRDSLRAGCSCQMSEQDNERPTG